MNPKNILFVDHAPAMGGAEHSLLMILKRLDRTRWQPHLSCNAGKLAETAARQNIATHIVPMPRLRRSLQAVQHLWTGIQTLCDTARKTGAQLIVANTVRAAFYAAPAAKLMSLPFVWYRRDFWLGESAPRHKIFDTLGKQLICALTTRIIANSEATAIRQPCPRKIQVIYNGIEIERFNPQLDGTALRQRFHIPLDAPLIGSLGRLTSIKRQDTFLRVLAEVRKELPETYGLIVGGAIFGDDSYAKELQQLTEQLGLAEHVIFTGQLEAPQTALAAMDVFVQPGDPEAFGLVNVEAMAMEKPLVAFAHGALPNIIVEAQTGHLIPSGDESHMTQSILELLRNPQQCRAMGQAGRARVKEAFTIERTVQEIEVALDTILSSS